MVDERVASNSASYRLGIDSVDLMPSGFMKCHVYMRCSCIIVQLGNGFTVLGWADHRAGVAAMR